MIVYSSVVGLLSCGVCRYQFIVISRNTELFADSRS